MPRERAVALAAAQSLVAAAVDPAFFIDGDPDYEPVRREQMRYSCQRVRSWRAPVPNPLLQYKAQPESVSSKKKERRVHLTVLLAAILEAYEMCITHFADVLSKESFPEYVANTIVQKAPGRKHGLEQLQATIASMLHTTTHPRVRAFASLCGISDAFNPPEKITLFLRTIERMYRLKATDAAKGLATYDDVSSVASVVFNSIGFGQAAARRVVRDLFHEPDPYWVFEYLGPICDELHVDRTWPTHAEAELLEQVNRLSSSVRNASGMRKVDGDAFLELILTTWNARAAKLYDDLDAACDAEEDGNALALAETAEQCRRRANIAPATADETVVFAALLDEYWLADVPWAELPEALAAWTRPLRDVQRLYAAFRKTRVGVAPRPWDWEAWTWEADWDWGGLVAAPAAVRPHSAHAPLTNDSGVLNLALGSLGDRNMQKMGQFLQLPARHLHKLVLRGNDMHGKGCENIAHAIRSAQPNVLELDLSDNVIGRDGAAALVKVLASKTCSIQVLRLDSNRLGNLVGRAFINDVASSNRSLRRLSMRRNELGCGQETAHLLQVHPTLSHLDLSWNVFRGAAVGALAAALADNATLQELDLGFNALGDTGFLALARALTTNKTLTRVSASHNNIAVVRDLKQLLKTLSSHPSLELLELCGNPLGPEMVAALAAPENRVRVKAEGCSRATASTYLLPCALEDR
ncbi:hypothetical protein ACHHYP_10819 [Achlya hypogyna]|uniref:Uncharacterized protein n=1 Tax=Achlya hypogyna TaxID=1202772 RepID=A0A1V9YKG9_ACHHY|nr:hypothetical protein ACHHYP_10819 [Achlya hypogyna]